MTALARIIEIGRRHDIGLGESFMTRTGWRLFRLALWCGLGDDCCYDSRGRRIVIRDYWGRLDRFRDWLAS